MMVALMFVALTSNVLAQTKEETNAKLTGHHEAIIKHTNAIATGEATTKDEMATQCQRSHQKFS